MVEIATTGAEHWDGPGWWPVFPILWLTLAVGVVALVAWRRRSDDPARRAGESRLAERYAAGEIDEEEYASRRAVLRSARR